MHIIYIKYSFINSFKVYQPVFFFYPTGNSQKKYTQTIPPCHE